MRKYILVMPQMKLVSQSQAHLAPVSFLFCTAVGTMESLVSSSPAFTSTLISSSLVLNPLAIPIPSSYGDSPSNGNRSDCRPDRNHLHDKTPYTSSRVRRTEIIGMSVFSLHTRSTHTHTSTYSWCIIISLISNC